MTIITERRRFRDIFRFDSWNQPRARSWRRGRSGALTVAGGNAVSVLAPSGSGVVPVAAGEPRREESGLLVSPDRSNLLAYSHAIAAQWTPTNVTSADGAAPGPDGGATSASTITETAATGEHKAERATTATLSASSYYTVRARAKCIAGTRNLRVGVRGTSSQEMIVSPAGVIAANNALDGGVRDLQNGWLEVWVRFVGQGSSYALVGLASGTTTSYAGNGTSKWAICGVSVDLAAECPGPLVTTSGASASTGAQTVDFSEATVLARLARGRIDIDLDFEVGATLLGTLDVPLVSFYQDATHYLDLYAKQISAGPGSMALGSTFTNAVRGLIWWGNTWWAAEQGMARKLAQWNGTSWTSVTVAPPGAQYFGPLVEFNGDLVSAILSGPGNVYRSSNGTTWTDLGAPGVNGTEELCVHAGKLYASDFDTVYEWSGTGTTWTSLGRPISTSFPILGLASWGGDLYCCGLAGSGSLLNSVKRWAGGTTWTGIGKPFGNAYNYKLHGKAGQLWVCGYGGADDLASWDGAAWTMRGSPGGAVTYNFCIDSSGDVWAVGSDNDNRIMKWNGASWSFMNQPDTVSTRWYAIASNPSGSIAVGSLGKAYQYSALAPSHALEARQAGGNTTLSTAGTLVAGHVLRARLRLRSDGSYRVRLLDLTSGTELGSGSGTLSYSALATTKLRLGADHTGAAARPIWLRGIEVR